MRIRDSGLLFWATLYNKIKWIERHYEIYWCFYIIIA